MQTEDNEIFDHDTDVDVTHKINSVELNNWIRHLNYIETEVVNLIGLCTNELSAKLNDETVVKRFNERKVENESMLDVLSKYSNTRTNIVECEDTQCDMAYISEHENYRNSYVKHIEKYRKLKDEFFSKAQRKTNI